MSLPKVQEVENYWRFELKYRLTFEQYLKVKNAIFPYIRYDSFTEAVPEHRYLVRSLYFDSLDYQSYNEKLGGDNFRYKFRIRTYCKTLDCDAAIRAEIKLRRGGKTEKYGAMVTPDSYCHFMKHYHWDCEGNPVLIEFERNLHAHVLRPKVLVEYHREGFRSRDKEDIRVTFDHSVRSAQTKSLFPQTAFFRQHYPHHVILEVKHRDQPPDWLSTIVQNQGLKLETNSKYCQGIDITQSELVNHALRV